MTDEPMTERWTFGEAPLDQTRAAADALRRATDQLLALEHEEPEVDRLVADVERALAALAGRVPPGPAPRVGPAVDGDGRVYLDHARDIGGFNPCFPAYELEVDGDRAAGRVTFPIAYEGPPGVVHGGFLALLFDCAVQHHNCDVGVAGKTTSLRLRFRRPAPVGTPLSFTLERAVDGDRIHSTGRLERDGRLLCEAEVDAVAGDRSALPPVSPRRPR